MVGFALGMERLVALLDEHPFDETPYRPEFYLVVPGAEAELAGLRLAEYWRDIKPDLQLQIHCGGGSLKSQMKKADRSGARFALILGDEELAANTVTVKDLRGDLPQQPMNLEKFEAILAGEQTWPDATDK